IEWVTANRVLPAVANISITISAASNATDQAIKQSVNSGVTYVVAAGNSNIDACNISPARASDAIAVGAIISSDTKAGYSNWGSCVDIWAPGTSIISAGHSSDTAVRTMSGTSMASPHVAGVAALYLSANPSASPATVRNNIYSTSTTGVVLGLDSASPNRVVYSWLDGTPPAAASPARVTIKKQTAGPGVESLPTTAFAYTAQNLSTGTFALYPNSEFVEPEVTSFGSGNMIRVTEQQQLGWNLVSINCVETSGGAPNVLNTTVSLANRRADIIVEEGEQVECTFVSEPVMPSAGSATVSGRVLTSLGRGAGGIRVDMLNASTNEVRYAVTNTFGYFSFADLRVGDFYVVSIPTGRKGNRRNRLTQTFTLNGDLAGLSFVLD